MDARVCLCDIDPTDANATRLVLARRRDGGGGGGVMEAGIRKFLKPAREGGTQDPRFVIFSVLANLRSRRMAPEHKEA
jgi:hypothetical protein